MVDRQTHMSNLVEIRQLCVLNDHHFCYLFLPSSVVCSIFFSSRRGLADFDARGLKARFVRVDFDRFQIKRFELCWIIDLIAGLLARQWMLRQYQRNVKLQF